MYVPLLYKYLDLDLCFWCHWFCMFLSNETVRQHNMFTIIVFKSFASHLFRLLIQCNHIFIFPSIQTIIAEKMQRTKCSQAPLPLSSFLFSVTSAMWHLMTLPPTPQRLCGAAAVMWALALWLMLEIEQGACKRDSSSSWGASQVECDKSPFTISAQGQG